MKKTMVTTDVAREFAMFTKVTDLVLDTYDGIDENDALTISVALLDSVSEICSVNRGSEKAQAEGLVNMLDSLLR